MKFASARWHAWVDGLKRVRQSLQGGPGYQGPSSDHFDGERFFNPGASAGKSWSDVLRWWSTRRRKPWPRWRDRRAAPQLPAALSDGEGALTLINHMTFLLQLPELTLLTDPVYSQRPSPVSFIGPQRAHAPGVPFEQLPPVDLVLVSHNHYDHLDIPTLRRLARRFAPVFVTGLGNGAFLREQGIARVIELDWWQQALLRGLRVSFTPAQHWSDRGWSNRNRTLWGGMWLQTGTHQIYFSGDSGYSPLFAQLRARFGAPDLALMPIGCYEPRWFMCEQHMNPDDAVRAHLDLGARMSVGCHYGCFRLTDEGIDDPLLDLATALQKYGVGAERFRAPLPGETLWLPAHRPAALLQPEAHRTSA
jgi:L-ascorbate metabolism protein UlaG (beta-lactamase superfamily)